jgi:hypothetical protein
MLAYPHILFPQNGVFETSVALELELFAVKG